jgi:mannose-6-phosphate isomerase-like protein (cupin superfamily)
MQAIIRFPGDGPVVTIGSSRVRFLAEEEPLSVTETVLEPGFPGPRPHRHQRTRDVFYVLEGTVTFHLDGESMAAPAGSFVAVPPGVTHTFSNPGAEPARLLNIMVPGGLEQYLKEAAAAAPEGSRPDPDVLARIASRYDLQPG